MPKQDKQSKREAMAGKDKTPGDIGDYTDENSLASKLLDQIDRVKDKLCFMEHALSVMSMDEDETLDFVDLDGMSHICQDMSNELSTAHEMICDPWIHRKEAPEPTPSQVTDSGASE